jgi:hypothetical protein
MNSNYTLLTMGAVVVVVGIFSVMYFLDRSERAVEKAKQAAVLREAGERIDWPVLLDALEAVEAPATPEQAQQAIRREGAYGVLQIRQLALDDVNRQCGTTVTLEEVAHNRNLSRWVCVQYVRIYLFRYPVTYESAARIWNGGPRGPEKEATAEYWTKVRRILLERGVEVTFHPSGR